MLRSLYIQNYALIEKLDISFETGFSVITGETGAGKSIILGAIGLLLGQRADVKAIRRGASKCIIEARFDIAAYGMRPFFEENELNGVYVAYDKMGTANDSGTLVTPSFEVTETTDVVIGFLTSLAKGNSYFKVTELKLILE